MKAANANNEQITLEVLSNQVGASFVLNGNSLNKSEGRRLKRPICKKWSNPVSTSASLFQLEHIVKPKTNPYSKD